MTVVAWLLIVYRQRSDLERCPAHAIGSAIAVEFGGWAEPDTCRYQDAGGQPVFPDAQFAEAVSTTPFLTVATPGTALSVVLAYALRALLGRSREEIQ